MRLALLRNLAASAAVGAALLLVLTAPAFFHAIPCPAAEAPAPLDDQGVFEIFQAGQKVGTEQFKITTSKEGVETEGETHLSIEQLGQMMILQTTAKLSLDPSLRPLAYAWSQEGSQASSLEMDLKLSPARITYTTVGGAKDERAFQLARDVVILDSNVFAHYEILVDHYASTSRGKQEFPAFVPQQAAPGMVTVKEDGAQNKALHGQKIKLRHVEVKSDLAKIDLWTDEQNHLQIIAMPEAKLEVIRQ